MLRRTVLACLCAGLWPHVPGCSPASPSNRSGAPVHVSTAPSQAGPVTLEPYGILSRTLEGQAGKPAYLVVQARVHPGPEVGQSNVMKVFFNGARLDGKRLVGVPANVVHGAFGPPSWRRESPRCNEMTGGWTLLKDDDWQVLNPHRFAFGFLRGIPQNCTHTIFLDVGDLVVDGDNTVEIRSLIPQTTTPDWPQKLLQVARLELIDDYRDEAALIMASLTLRQSVVLPPYGTHRDDPEKLVERAGQLKDSFPDWAAAHMRRAAIFHQQADRLDRAAELYRQYLDTFKQGSEFDEMAARLVILQCKAGRLDEAENLSKQLARTLPRSPWTEIAASWVALKRGRPTPRRTVRVPRTGIAPTLDGKLDDECWQRAVRMDISPIGVVRGEPGEVMLTWDDKNLYVGFRFATAGRSRMPGGFGKQDDPVWRGEAAETFLCPDATFLTYYELNFGPNGARYDGKNTYYYHILGSWNPSWKTETRVEDDCWTGEAAIPFAELGVPTPKRGEIWSGNFVRCGLATATADRPARRFYASWAELPKPNFHWPQYYGFIVFE